jgi:transcription initiation factor IIE alpha subunit
MSERYFHCPECDETFEPDFEDGFASCPRCGVEIEETETTMDVYRKAVLATLRFQRLLVRLGNMDEKEREQMIRLAALLHRKYHPIKKYL